jgi:hypothetical protein
MKIIDRERYRLSSGREFDANFGLISIARKKGGTFMICEGYDTEIDDINDPQDEQAWSADERRELADFMIAQWTDFKESQR